MEQIFKVGELVRLKVQPKTKVFIIEVTTQTCYANVTQTWYLGRIIGENKWSPSIDKTYTRFSQIELETIPEMSKELKKMIEDYKATKSEKEKFCEEQDFGKAAKARDRENGLKIVIIEKMQEEDIDIELREL